MGIKVAATFTLLTGAFTIGAVFIFIPGVMRSQAFINVNKLSNRMALFNFLWMDPTSIPNPWLLVQLNKEFVQNLLMASEKGQ